MAHTLKISDGTTTCDLLAGTDYKVITAGGWAPRRAQRSPSMMSSSPYMDVDEGPIAISIKGTNKGNCLTKLGTLSDLLDQAEAWGRGENVSAVYVEYWAEDSTLAASVKAVIVGPPSFGDFLQVPGHFDSDVIGGGTVLGTNDDPIYLQFRRRGLWLGATEAEGQTGGAGETAMPGIQTSAAFTDTFKVLVPYDVSIEFDTGATGGLTKENEGYLLLTNATAKLDLSEAEDWTDSTTDWSEPAVAAASGGNVKRHTPATTNPAYIQLNTSGFNDDIRMIQVFAVLANNHATTTWETYFTWRGSNSTIITQQQKTKLIDASTTDPRIFWWDPITLTDELDNHYLRLYVTPSAAVGTLDFDYFVILGLDENSSIIHLPRIGTLNSYSAEKFFIMHLKGRPLTHLTPLIFEAEGLFDPLTIDSYIPYDGYTVPHMTSNVIAGTLIALDNGGDWIMQNSDSTPILYELTYSRYRGYLTPR